MTLCQVLKAGFMPSVAELAAISNASIVAPAGHGKTEVITGIAALGRRALILTHTHAGVHAIRSRLKRLGVPNSSVSVDTIAGWCMRYAHAFPRIAHPPPGMPKGELEWSNLYRGTILALGVTAIRDVVASSYDRILIDEYQDCNALQHEFASTLASIVPTMIFGDPMQGIFEFAGANLNWSEQIYPQFPLAGNLETPYRWQGKNPELGAWIAETRMRLMNGEPIDLASGPIIYRQSDNAFDMATFFDGIDGREGTQAAIHCNRSICNRLAQATRGGFQAIEEMAAIRLQSFAAAWDLSQEQASRISAVETLIKDCFNIRKPEQGGVEDQEDENLEREMNIISQKLGGPDGAIAGREFFALARHRSRWRLFRGEIWRDGERAMSEIQAGRASTMSDAATIIRQRITNAGRKLPARTISTPLLLKGLEFDHVVIPDATHFAAERFAQAKLFYVAISRATRSLTISSSKRFLQFQTPRI